MDRLATRYKGITPYMVFCCFVYLLGALLYGIDTGSFGPLQALPSFRSTFGVYDRKTKEYALSSNVSSAMNSIPFAGQAVGALLSSFVIDLFGYVCGGLRPDTAAAQLTRTIVTNSAWCSLHCSKSWE